MQRLKDTVRDAILRQATQEFAACGFEKASLRRIAAGSGVTVGNLYRYYTGKHELFLAVTKPVFDQIAVYIRDHDEWAPLQEPIDIEKLLRESSKKIADFIIQERLVLTILIDGSRGTVFEKAKTRMVGLMDGHVMEHFREMFGPRRARSHATASRMIATGFMEGLFELIRRPLPAAETSRAIGQYIEFQFKGFLKSFGVEDPGQWLMKTRK